MACEKIIVIMLFRKRYIMFSFAVYSQCFLFYSDYYDVFLCSCSWRFVEPDTWISNKLIFSCVLFIDFFFCAADYEAVVKLSDGFNGADLRNVCTEAGSAFSPLRSPELDHSSLYFSNFSLHCYDVQGWFCCFFFSSRFSQECLRFVQKEITLSRRTSWKLHVKSPITRSWSPSWITNQFNMDLKFLFLFWYIV